MPPLSCTLAGTPDEHDEVILDELWLFVGSKKNPRWLWLALGRRYVQVLAFHIGGRALKDAQELWQQLSAPWRSRLVFTDGYPVYGQLFSSVPRQHCVALKGEGETSEIEGANNALRQRVSYLVRKSSAFARSTLWLTRRVLWMLFHWNQQQAKRWTDTPLE